MKVVWSAEYPAKKWLNTTMKPLNGNTHCTTKGVLISEEQACQPIKSRNLETGFTGGCGPNGITCKPHPP